MAAKRARQINARMHQALEQLRDAYSARMPVQQEIKRAADHLLRDAQSGIDAILCLSLPILGARFDGALIPQHFLEMGEDGRMAHYQNLNLPALTRDIQPEGRIGECLNDEQLQAMRDIVAEAEPLQHAVAEALEAVQRVADDADKEGLRYDVGALDRQMYRDVHRHTMDGAALPPIHAVPLPRDPVPASALTCRACGVALSGVLAAAAPSAQTFKTYSKPRRSEPLEPEAIRWQADIPPAPIIDVPGFSQRLLPSRGKPLT